MGERLEGRTDVVSLGVVAFEMLSGVQPFPGNNVTSILYKLVHSEPVRPTDLEVLGLLPDKWHQVFSKVLAKNPVERHADAAAFVSDLEMCLGSWFGALEGETVIMTAPGGEEGKEEKEKEEEKEEEETVIMRGPEHTEETLPTTGKLPEEDEEEGEGQTITLMPESKSAQVAASSAIVGEQDELVTEYMPSPHVGSDEATVLIQTEETRTVAPEPSSNSVPAAKIIAETMAISFPDSDLPVASATVPPTVPKRSVTEILKGRGVKYALFAVATVALLAFAGVGLTFYLTLGSIELPSVQTPPPAPIPELGVVDIRSDPEGATVWIDGEEIGITPLELAGLELGNHLLRLEMEGFRPEELPAALSGESPLATFDVSLTRRAAPPPPRAYFAVQSTPPGALVTIDGRLAGNTPLSRYRSSPGWRTVRLELEGFEPWERAFELRAGLTESIFAELEPVEAPVEAPPVPEEPPAPTVREGDLVERGIGVVDPKCIECPGVSYPEAARRARIQGLVQVRFIINETGAVQDVQIEQSGGEVFDGPVLEVVKGWRYEPATKDGIRVKVRWVQRFRFQRGR